MANIPIKDFTEITELHDGDMTVIGDGSQTNSKFNLGKALGELIKRAETYTKAQIDTFLSGKQPILVSGTNIKTINEQSLLGSGDIEVGGLVDDVQVDNVSVVQNKIAKISGLAKQVDLDETNRIQKLIIQSGIGKLFNFVKRAYTTFKVNVQSGAIATTLEKMSGNTRKCRNMFDMQKLIVPIDVNIIINYDSFIVSSIGNYKNVILDLKEFKGKTIYISANSKSLTGEGAPHIQAIIDGTYTEFGGTLINRELTISQNITDGKLLFYVKNGILATESSCEYSNVIISTENNSEWEPYTDQLLSANVDKIINNKQDQSLLQEISIPQSIQNLEGYGWGVNDIHNEVDFVNKKFIKRIGRVDLGDCTWETTTTSISGKYRLRTTNTITNIKEGVATEVSNILCSKYKADTANNIYTTKEGIGVNVVAIVAYDENYNQQSSASGFKTAMNGVYLYYELATPQEIDITDELEGFNNSFNVEGGGSLTFHNPSDYNVDLPTNFENMEVIE